MFRETPVRLAAGGALALAAAFGFGRFVYTPILPYMTADGLSPSAAGFVAAMNYLGYLAGALIGAAGVTRAGQRWWFFGSLFVSGIALLAMGYAESIAALSILRFAGGATGSIVMVTAATLVFERVVVLKRPKLAMLPFCGVGLGIAASSVLVSVLAARGIGWRGMWIASGIAGLILAFSVVALVVRHEAAAALKSSDASVEPSGRTQAMRMSWPLARLIVSYGLFGFGYVITATFIVVITRETPALAPLEPVIWSVVGLAGAASIPFWSTIAGRIGDTPAYAVACMAEATGVALSVLVASEWAIIAAAILLGGTFMAITAIGLNAGRRIAGGSPQRIQAVMTAAFGLGQVAGPLAAGQLREASGTFVSSSLAAAAALAVAAALAALTASER